MTDSDKNARPINENSNIPASTNRNYCADDTGIYVCERKINQNYNMHWHDMLEIELFVSGEGTVQVNERIYNITPGLISFINFRDFHEVSVKKPIRLYHLHFESFAVSDSILDRLHENPYHACRLNESDTKQIIALIELMIRGKEINEEYRTEYMRSLLNSLIIYCFEANNRSDISHIKDVHMRLAKTYESSRSSESRINTIQNAIRYIKMHFTENITMSSVAKLFYTQEQYFCTKFHEILGVTFTEYLRSLRLEYAANIIKHTVLPIKEIYSSCGYQSRSHFMREFKKYYGISPMQMRKEYKLKNKASRTLL
ncbi:MAG: helix-turn-helix domain-containing protein [Eubacteriales bacterium]